MSNYTKSTNFATKDALASGNPAKIVKGTEIDTEFNNIATAIATKADSSGTAASLTAGAAQQLTTTDWTVLESGGYIYFKHSGVNKMRLDSSGNLVVTGNVTAYGTL
jgi:diaminopimelate epimerase